MECEYRPCVINENQQAVFLHLMEYDNERKERKITAVVELDTGEMRCVSPQSIKFIDGMFSKAFSKLKKSKAVVSDNKKKINYQKIIDLYNSVCTNLPKVKTLTEARKNAIKKANDFIDGDFETLFKTVNDSDFLSNGWKNCSFDWILKQSNLVKIIEGNYDSKPDTENKTDASYDSEDYENYTIDEWYDKKKTQK